MNEVDKKANMLVEENEKLNQFILKKNEEIRENELEIEQFLKDINQII